MEADTGDNSQPALLALLCLGIHLVYFFLIKTYVPSINKDRRRLSWILTLVTAIVVSCGGYYVLFMHVRTTLSRPILYEEYSHTPGVGFYRYDIAYSPAAFRKLLAVGPLQHLEVQDNGDGGIQDHVSLAEARIAFYKTYDRAHAAKPWYRRAIFFDTRFQPADSSAGLFFTIFFAMYLVTDILCGTRYYKERITFLAGWVHHIGYLIVAYYTVVIAKEAHSFSAYLMIEVPTVFIGLGFVDRRLRNDMLFGTVYVFFRILFDFSLTHEYIFGRPDMHLVSKIIICSKSLLHIQFFSDWVKQQRRLRKKASLHAVTAESCESLMLDTKDASYLEKSTFCMSDVDQQNEPIPISAQRIPVAQYRRREQGEVPNKEAVAIDSLAQRTKSGRGVESTTTRQRVASKQSAGAGSAASIRITEGIILQHPVSMR